MGTGSILAIIALIPMYGFGIGLHLDLIDSGDMFRLESLVKNASIEPQDNLLMSTAFMSGNGDNTIQHASIGLGLGKVLVDPDETPNNGNEYFDNKINECVFHSDESIADNSCVVCKIVDTEFDDRCKDYWIDFEGLEHGADNQEVLDYLQDNFGILLTFDIDDNDPTDDELTIYDSTTDGGCDTDIEHPFLPGDDPTIGNLLIMKENDQDDANCQPNDNGDGGTLMFVLEKPMYLESIDVVDHDSGADGDSVIEAYQTPDCSGNPIVVKDILKLGENSLQTVVVNANDVSCFKIIYFDSGGFTNIHLRCIPCEGAWIDFDIDEQADDHGTEDQAVKEYLLNNFGITLEVDANGIRPDEVTIYDSRYMGDNVDGCDFDLEHPLIPDDPTVGNLLVFKESGEFDNNCQPNDSAVGGMLTFKLDTPAYLKSVDVVDHDNNGQSSVIEAYETVDCSGTPIVTADIVEMNFENSLQRVFVNANNVSCFKINYPDSGGFTNIHLTCVQDESKKEIDPETVIAKGKLDFPDGYWASDTKRIPLDGGADVFESMGVAIQVFKSNIDFDELSHGEKHKAIEDYLLHNFGVILEVDGFNGWDEAVIYDSFFNGGADPDLEHTLIVGNPNDPDDDSGPDDLSVGKLICMKEESENQPNDSAAGGIMRFKFIDPTYVSSIDVVDHDRGADEDSVIRVYDNVECVDDPNAGKNLIVEKDILKYNFENSLQTVDILANNVQCIEIHYEDSGCFTNFNLACPDFAEKSIEHVFETSFEDNSESGEISNWSLNQDRSTTPHLGDETLEITDFAPSGGLGSQKGARTGDYYLAGRGDIDDNIIDPSWAAYDRVPIDISQHTDMFMILWYSYEDTESDDNFALYYQIDNGGWVEIINLGPELQIADNTQQTWRSAIVPIPDGNDLEIEFSWETSTNSEHVMLDDLIVIGTPLSP